MSHSIAIKIIKRLVANKDFYYDYKHQTLHQKKNYFLYPKQAGQTRKKSTCFKMQKYLNYYKAAGGKYSLHKFCAIGFDDV